MATLVTPVREGVALAAVDVGHTTLHRRIIVKISHLVTHLMWSENPQEGLELCGLVHEEAHRCFSCNAPRVDAGGIDRPLVQLIASINYSIREKIFTAVPCTSLSEITAVRSNTHELSQ